jgi:hypothetical protein
MLQRAVSQARGLVNVSREIQLECLALRAPCGGACWRRRSPVMPSPCLLGPLDPAQLTRARLRIAWEMLAQVAEHLDLVPAAARGHVADALSELAQARALVEEEGVRHE